MKRDRQVAATAQNPLQESCCLFNKKTLLGENGSVDMYKSGMCARRTDGRGIDCRGRWVSVWYVVMAFPLCRFAKCKGGKKVTESRVFSDDNDDASLTDSMTITSVSGSLPGLLFSLFTNILNRNPLSIVLLGCALKLGCEMRWCRIPIPKVQLPPYPFFFSTVCPTLDSLCFLDSNHWLIL